MPALTAYPQNALFNNGKTKSTDAKTNNIKNSVKINTPKTTPVVIATKEVFTEIFRIIECFE